MCVDTQTMALCVRALYQGETFIESQWGQSYINEVRDVGSVLVVYGHDCKVVFKGGEQKYTEETADAWGRVSMIVKTRLFVVVDDGGATPNQLAAMQQRCVERATGLRMPNPIEEKVLEKIIPETYQPKDPNGRTRMATKIIHAVKHHAMGDLKDLLTECGATRNEREVKAFVNNVLKSGKH